MAVESCGILFYRFINKEPQFFLLHRGDCYTKDRNDAVWEILSEPQIHSREHPKDVAILACKKHLGFNPIEDKNMMISLGHIKQRPGFYVYGYAYEYDLSDEFILIPNRIKIEYPLGSNRIIEVPEFDCGLYFNYKETKLLMRINQLQLVDHFMFLLNNK